MCVYVCVCKHDIMYVYIYIHAYTHIYIYIYICVCVCVCECVCVCVCIISCIFLNLSANTTSIIAQSNNCLLLLLNGKRKTPSVRTSQKQYTLY